MRVQRNRQERLFEVTATARGLTSRAGTGAVRVLADRIGLSAALSRACGGAGWRRHDPGAVLRDLTVTLADGGVCFSDIEALRVSAEPGAPVASDSTAWRLVDRLADDDLIDARLSGADRAARGYVWANGGRPPSVQRVLDAEGDDERVEPIFVDLDATLVTSHSEKEMAAPTYKRGFGFHPFGAWLDRGDGTGEALSVMLRSGNAGANSAADHCELLEGALAGLDGLLPEHARLVVRADSAGSSYEFLDYARQAGVGFQVNVRLSRFRDVVRVAHDDPDSPWVTAVTQDGAERDGAAVIELIDTVDLSKFPDRTRLIVRREPRHPGAQLTFDDVDGHRFTAFVTDQDGEIVELDRSMRAHAMVEDRVRDQKQTGWQRFPSHDFAINAVWCQLGLLASNLLVWLGVLGLEPHDPLRRAQPTTIRYRLLHVAGKITRSARRTRLQLDRDWPWATQIVAIYRRLWALPAPA